MPTHFTLQVRDGLIDDWQPRDLRGHGPRPVQGMALDRWLRSERSSGRRWAVVSDRRPGPGALRLVEVALEAEAGVAARSTAGGGAWTGR